MTALAVPRRPQFLLRLQGEHLAPDYQPGDVLVCEEVASADKGHLVIVAGAVTDPDEATARYYEPDQGWTVVGRVVDMYRKLVAGHDERERQAA